MEVFNRLVNELGHSLGLEELASQGKEDFFLTFDEKITVHFRYDSKKESLILFSSVGELNQEQVAVWGPKFLEANVFWQGTSEATLGVSSNNGLVVLCYQAPIYSWDFPKFRNYVETFVNEVEKWQEMIEKEG